MEQLKHFIEEAKRVAGEQEAKGMKKYGQPLDPFDSYDWLDMEFEELIDAGKYNRAEKVKRDFVIERIKTILKHADFDRKDEIIHWLDLLQGKKS